MLVEVESGDSEKFPFGPIPSIEPRNDPLKGVKPQPTTSKPAAPKPTNSTERSLRCLPKAMITSQVLLVF